MIVPTIGRLVLQKIKEEEKPKGSLILPDPKNKQDKYMVIKKYLTDYPGLDKLPPTEGTIVYIDKYKGVELVKDGQTYLVIEDQDIVAYEA